MDRWYWNVKTRDGIIVALREAMGSETSREDAEKFFEYWGREEALRLLLDCSDDEFFRAVDEALEE